MHETISAQTVILVPANLKEIYKLYQKDPTSRSYSWLYLSKDALLFTKLQSFFHNDTKFVDIGDLLQEISHRYRQDYIDYIGSLSVRNNSIYWWITSVSEKNPFISTVFLNFCYLKIVEQKITTSANWVIICDSDSLIKAIKDTFSNRSTIKFRTLDSKLDRTVNTILNHFSGFLKKGFFTIRFIFRIGIAKGYAIARCHRKLEKYQKKIAVHSWTDARSFPTKGIYRETYFGNMSCTIKRYSPEFFTISNILPTMHYPKAVMSLLMCDNSMIIFEEFLSIADVFRSLFSVIIKMPSSIDIPPLSNIELSSVIKEELYYDRYESSRSETALLHYYAGKRIARRGDFKTVIYTFENHMWEKMLCLGIRESNTNCRLIGYAHSIVSPMYMFYTLSRFERDIAPIPDCILVNGKIAKKRLSEAGFDEEIIFISGAYRYAYLKNEITHHRATRTNKSILIIPTSELDETVELIDKAISAYKDLKNINIVIKPHPTVSAGKIIALYPEMPPHFSFSVDPIEKLLEETDLVLFTETTVAIESLMHHIPVLHIKSNVRIDMNLFEGFDLIQSVSKPEDIHRISLELMTASSAFNDQYDRIVGDFFAPVDDKVLIDLLR